MALSKENSSFIIISQFLLEEKFERWILLRQGREEARYGNRDETLHEDENSMRIKREARQRRLAIIRSAINLLLPEVTHLMVDQLRNYYEAAVLLRKRHFDDNSDDSDLEDDTHLNQIQALSSRTKQHQEVKQIHSTSFWSKSNRNKPIIYRKNKPVGGGLVEKLELERPLTNITKDSVEKIKDALFSEKRDREKIALPGVNMSRRFVAQYRGINYMHDRWSIEARRYHYKLDETGYAQFSEAVLKTLPYDFYTELTRENDFYRNPEHYKSLIATAQRLRQLYYGLSNNQGQIVENATAPTVGPYLFNGVTDWMQHEFTNGISRHLLNLKQYRAQNRHQLAEYTLNSFNYAVSTSDCPNHALRYALGLKQYYADNFDLHYNADGSITNSHAGKVYIVLQEVDEFLAPGSVNHVLKMSYEGRVPIIKNRGGDIASELENDYIGYIPGDKIVYQKRLKFPSFNGPHRPIYEVKYGMDAPLYALFGHLIRTTWQMGQQGPSNELHREVLQLLKEWLCSYYEVFLLEVAQRKAASLNGSLVYIDHENMQKQSPDFVPFNGGDAHMHHRNQVHLLQNFRYIAARFPDTERANTDAMIRSILGNAVSLRQLVDGIVFEPSKPGGVGQIPDLQDRDFYQTILGRPEKERETSQYILNRYRQTINRNARVENIPPVVNLTDINYLYSDVDINIVLNQALIQGTVRAALQPYIYAAQHPFVQGFHARPSMELFENTIRQILLSNDLTLFPINNTVEQSSTHQPVVMRGTHWIGLIFRPNENGGMTIEYIDPAIPNQILIQRTREILERIARELNIQINFQHLTTEQQSVDVDCGPWTVDNLTRRAQNLPIRTRHQVSGVNLRTEQSMLYNENISITYQRKFS